MVLSRMREKSNYHTAKNSLTYLCLLHCICIGLDEVLQFDKFILELLDAAELHI